MGNELVGLRKRERSCQDDVMVVCEYGPSVCQSTLTLTQVGIHDEQVEVLLQVAPVLRHLPPQQVEHGSQQVVAQTQVVTHLAHSKQVITH